MHDMIKFTKPKIVRLSILIIFALGMVSISGNLSTIEKAMAICFDTPFCDTPHTTFSFGRLHTGDCTMQWANFYLLPGGQGYLEAYITSTSSNDAWGFKNIHFTGSQPFNIGDLWSPTLPEQDPNIGSTGPNWSTYFTYSGNYDLVNQIQFNYHC